MSDDKHELTREQQEKRAAENRQRKERAARARSQLTLAMAKIEPVLALARSRRRSFTGRLYAAEILECLTAQSG